MQREHALHPHTKGYLPHGEGFRGAAMFLRNHIAAEDLNEAALGLQEQVSRFEVQ